MTCGIYMMKFTGTTKAYIGQSTNIENRITSHLYSIKNNLCSNKIRNAVDTYGLPIFEVLLECSKEELNTNEVEAIEIFDSINNGFNTCEGGGDFPSLSGELHPMSKYSDIQVIYAFDLLVDYPQLTYKKISELTGIDASSVAHICSGQNHKWLKAKFPDRYEKLPNKEYDRSAKGLGKSYPKIVSPLGEVYEVTNTHHFAKQHQLDQGNLNKLLNYKIKSTKGWKRMDASIGF